MGGRYGKYGELKRLERLWAFNRSAPSRVRSVEKHRPDIRREKKEDRSVVCRKGRAADHRFVVSLARDVFRPFGPYGRIVAEWWEVRDIHWVVAQIGKKPVGFVALRPRRRLPGAAPGAEVTALAVHPRYLRRGIGRRLLEAADAWAREEGYFFLEAHTSEDNVAARALFEKMGYRERGTIPSYYPAGQTAVRMIKPLIF